MFTAEYNHTSSSDILKYFAKIFNSRVKNGYLLLNKEFGDGFIRLIDLPNGLQALISDYTLNRDILFQRKKNAEDFFTLRFDEVINTNTTVVTNAKISLAKSAVFLISTKHDWLFYANSGTRIKGISIIFSREWLENFLGIEKRVGDLLKKYFTLKTTAFNYEPLNESYQKLIDEIIFDDKEIAFERLIIQNRIMLLIELFFTRVYQKIQTTNFDVKISSDDLIRLKMVETELLKDFSIVPPSISKLARMATMSPSKLKTSFREIYGLPIYQYFQKHRMNKAKAMLLSQKYSVKQVGMLVGYSNLSNFAKAFKKSFDQLPSDILL